MIQQFLLGGYTKRQNPGIQHIEFDAEKATFSTPHTIAELDSPTYLALDRSGTLLFSILKAEGKGGVQAFKRIENEWQPITRCLNTETSGCHITYREASHTVYVANYHLGQIDSYHFNNDELTPLQTIKHQGSGPHPDQASARLHFVGLNKAENLLFACDLGSDKVVTYLIDQSGKLTLNDEIQLPKGTGPRHLIIDNKETYAYVVGELNSTTISLHISPDGKLTYVERYLNIPKEAVEKAHGAAIRLTSDGRFLFVSSRFYNAIIVFRVLPEGKLEKVQVINSRGEIPRDFILDETERYLLVPHQDTDNIAVFEIDQTTGQCQFLHNLTIAPECVCIVPLDA